MEIEGKDKSDEDCIDFAAATTATLGVPSPNLSKTKSFDESPRSDSDQRGLKKGDAEEEAEVLRVLKLSESNSPSTREAISVGDVLISSDENVHKLKSIPVDSVHILEDNYIPRPLDVDTFVSSGDNASLTLTDDREKDSDKLISAQLGEVSLSNGLAKCNSDTSILYEATQNTSEKDTVHDHEVEPLSTPVIDSIEELHKQIVDEHPGLIACHADSVPTSDGIPSVQEVEPFVSNIDGGEPIYEGEECILDLGKTVCEDREPVYEGEMVLAEQADMGAKDAFDVCLKDEITLRQGKCNSEFSNFCFVHILRLLLFFSAIDDIFFSFQGNLSTTS